VLIYCLKIKTKNANNLIKELKPFINKNFKIKKEDNILFIPLLSENKEEIEKIKKIINEKGFSDIFLGFEKKELEKINKNKIEDLEIKSFDIIGDIAITIIPKELLNKKYEIGEKIAKLSKVKTVLMEKEGRKGEFRLQEFECIYGENKRETIYKENRATFFLNVEKVYFSPRLSTDRLEISKQIKEGEIILVMFAGVLPYPIVISKNSKPFLIISIEKNPNTLKYSLKNIEINKIENIISFIGDVRDVLPISKDLFEKFKEFKNNSKNFNYKINKISENIFSISPFEIESNIINTKQKNKLLFDRILMPLPKGGESFLDLAFENIKKGGIVHYYQFVKENELNETLEKIKKISESFNKKIEFLNIKKAGQIGPRTYRIRIDMRVY